METLAEEDEEDDALMNSMTKTDRTEDDQNTDRDQNQDQLMATVDSHNVPNKDIATKDLNDFTFRK